MAVPKFRITCALCRKPIPLSQDVHALDREWKRRFPALPGVLACERCATRTHWRCELPTGGFVDGHIPASVPDGADFDAWSHLLTPGTHKALVIKYPRSGLLQGAESYLRHVEARPYASPQFVARFRAVLTEWEAGADLDPFQEATF
ncbi:hypothetical protein [Streptomyces sp. NBC_01304]|uniref:hypothetical protein n=1 Tax=Streptomyces sp. NBC_01304 TaxID=2903818 RepID=UPI002E0D9865|nr:hypothetical protein OG430_48020 [Streptomyces sp. NBC_01304]